MKKSLLFIFPILISSCVGIPGDVSPVTDFQIDRYLGTWYEIARLDHSFERGLESVTAAYSFRDDGGVKVVNKGFDPKKNIWKEASGKAYFLDSPSTGRLKVSFWGPFYSSYNIIDLDAKKYSYSMVCGPKKSYLWILAREPHMQEMVKADLIKKAKALGFETDQLIHVTHRDD